MTVNGTRAGLRVLLLDDDIGLLRMASLCLRLEGFDVVTAGNGALGLAAMQAYDFDAVVLDLRMPVMDGRAFYKEMREAGYDVPVMILSAYGAERARAELGAQAAFEKPFEPERLAGAVREMLRRHTSAASSRIDAVSC